MNLKTRLGQACINLGLRLLGETKEPDMKQRIKDVHLAIDAANGAGGVVEASDTPDQWEPGQTGGVVIAEPTLMALHRKGKL